ncbi:hypothetical protein NM208_g10841 [Fusarium decemcellulare]|uniref:Uncharacterized protein n=1 Tax=Fusarium decemcellulare TaxID=57161 RepID=A0ACC1RWH3_9HYPO|nr:hypothetical protein NM208_g10841 [Fusarium decemcellulare]
MEDPKEKRSKWKKVFGSKDKDKDKPKSPEIPDLSAGNEGDSTDPGTNFLDQSDHQKGDAHKPQYGTDDNDYHNHHYHHDDCHQRQWDDFNHRRASGAY